MQIEYLGSLESAIARATVGEGLLYPPALTKNVCTLNNHWLLKNTAPHCCDSVTHSVHGTGGAVFLRRNNIGQRERNKGGKRNRKQDGKKETYS
jgi:hypothetical protein